MDMGLAAFVFTIATGTASTVVYEGAKAVLGSTFSKLEAFAKNDDRETFELVLQTAIESNEEIKQQLEQLQRGEKITIVNQQHSGTGDNVAGDKIVKG